MDQQFWIPLAALRCAAQGKGLHCKYDQNAGSGIGDGRSCMANRRLLGGLGESRVHPIALPELHDRGQDISEP